MCGIFLYGWTHNLPIKFQSKLPKSIEQASNLCQHRGPDQTQSLAVSSPFWKLQFVFHRLAINGLNPEGNQPFEINDVVLVCNGEIYNYKQLFESMSLDWKEKSDCEILIHLYKKWGIQKMTSMLDGVFSFLLYDKQTHELFLGHDPIGVRSMYWFVEKNSFGICSEMKSLTNFSSQIQMFPPGTITRLKLNELTPKKTSWNYYKIEYPILHTNETLAIQTLQKLLTQAVYKRLECDRGNVSCLLSGGLDSSIITSIASQKIPQIQTFSIGFPDSVDLNHASLVANHLKTNHTKVVVTEKDMLHSIEETIYQIETMDVTTIRASVPMFLLSKYIQKHSESRVILSGEGADETSGSYLYFHNAPSPEEFRQETFRLMRDNQHFDILRADKTTAGAGLELRVPFYDRDFINYYMSIEPSLKMVRNGYEKYLLRQAFKDYVPSEIAWRRKDGFSDGVSSLEKPWYSIIENYTQTHFQLSEKDYYQKVFLQFYKSNRHIVPYQWLPKWSGDIQNPSNRLITN